MVRSGTVIQLDFVQNAGIIREKTGKEFYFNISECDGFKLPAKNSPVTFIRDRDFKATDVAILVKIAA